MLNWGCAFLGLGLLLALVSCAQLRSPVESGSAGVVGESGGELEARSEEEYRAVEGAVRLTIEEGRPAGLLLRIQDGLAKRGEQLWLYRRAGEDGSWELYQRVVLRARVAQALRSERGLDFLDRQLEAGLSYQWAAMIAEAGDEPGKETEASARRRRSGVVRLRWPGPSRPPQDLVVEPLTRRAVGLRWRPREGRGLIILRRDLLRRGGYQRLAVLSAAEASGMYVDRAVRPGGVYAYRCAHLVQRGQLQLFGLPSEEFFVTVPMKP